MIILLTAYLVGYFISFGIAFGFKEEKDSWWSTFSFAIFLGFLSWINIGLLVGDLFNILIERKREALTPKTSTDEHS